MRASRDTAGIDFDPDVAAIFTEEALELIDVSEHALWTGARSRPVPNTARR